MQLFPPIWALPLLVPPSKQNDPLFKFSHIPPIFSNPLSDSLLFKKDMILHSLYINSTHQIEMASHFTKLHTIFLRISSGYDLSKKIVMGARIPRHVMFVLLCVFCISDASITEKPSSQAIQETKKLDYQEKNQMAFSHPMTNIIHQGADPISPPSPTTMEPTTSGGSWCIASPTTSPTALQVALDYACGYGGADCTPIQPSGTCFEPNTVRDHASYAFNDYYQKHPGATSCVFGGAAQLTSTDPSHGSCRYSASTGTPMTPPTIPMTPPMSMTPTIPMTPPSTTSPDSPYAPGGSGGFGSDLSPPTGYDTGFGPAGSPNSAADVSINLMLFITMNFLVFSVAVMR